MKRLILSVARLLLPLARRVWGGLPARVRDRARRPLRRVRTALGLGRWARHANPYKAVIDAHHQLVPLPIQPSGTPASPAPAVEPDTVLVTVVITAHDDGPFIKTCLHSVRCQDITDWECVVVDDASVDDTAAIVLRQAEEDPRITLVRRDRNGGLAAARDTGIAAARGRYITFLDADDFMFPNTLGVRVESARSDDPTVAGSWCDWASVSEATGLEYTPGAAGRFGTIDYRTGGGENQIISTSPLMRREVVVSLGGYDDEFRTAEDFEFATRLFRNGFRLRFADVVGVAYRQKRSSMIAGDPFGHARNAMRIYDYMARPLAADAVASTATAPILEPLRGVPSEIKRLERLVTFLTFAVLSGDEEQISGVHGLLPPGLLGASTFLVDVEGRIDGAIRRHSTRVSNFTRSDRDRVETEVKTLFAARSQDDGDGSAIEPHPGRIIAARLNGLPPRHARVRGRRRMQAAGEWDVVLRADDPDAARELLLVGRELVERGFRVAMVDIGRADLRRRMLFEGVFRVTDPLGPARLLISSAGQTVDIDARRHLVVSAEPTPMQKNAIHADRVHVRGPWECAPSSDQPDVVVAGWHTRHDRIFASVSPVGGQVRRSRVDTALVVGNGSPVPDAVTLRAAVDGFDLLFTTPFAADPAVTVGVAQSRVLAPYVHAVIAVGDSVPADALAYGTPVLQIGGDCPSPAAVATSPDRLGDDLRAVRSVRSPAIDSDQDPLAIHVDAAFALLELT